MSIPAAWPWPGTSAVSYPGDTPFGPAGGIGPLTLEQSRKASGLSLVADEPSSSLDDLKASQPGFLQSILESLNTSALEAEARSTDSANRLARELLREQQSFNSREAQLARDFEAQQATSAMEFSERQAATQYQRAVADLKAAGLNPILAVQQGGNSAMSGVAGSGTAASSSVGSVYKSNFSSAKSSDLEALSTLLNGLSGVLKGIGSIIPG